MFTKKQLTKLILINLLIACLAISLSVAGVLFALSQMKSIAHSIDEKKKVSAALTKRSETYAQMKQDIGRYTNAEEHITRALVPIDDISPFTSALEALGTRNGIDETYKFGIPTMLEQDENLSLASVEYTLEMHANRQSLITYLKNFEALPYFSGITGMTIVGAEERGVDELSTVSMRATLYAKQN